MPYRGPNSARQAQQMADNQFIFAGTPVIWRQYVSAGGGNPTGGLGPTAYYQQRTITALCNNFTEPEILTPAGMFVSGMVMASTREKLARNDLIQYNGTGYRVYSDSVPSPISNLWQSLLKRGG